MSKEISVAQANSYIENYLNNFYNPLPVPQPNSQCQTLISLKSLIVDASQLRNYLDNNASIVDVKFMFGVRPYSNSSAPNVKQALTMIVAGYDADGNYVPSTPATSSSSAMFLDECAPCPMDCPVTGNAAKDLIVI